MKHILLVLSACSLLFLSQPSAECQQLSITGQVEVADTATGSNGFHGPYEIDFGLADSTDLVFAVTGMFHGRITLSPKVDVASDEARKDSVTLFAADTHRVFSDTIITWEWFKINQLLGAKRAHKIWQVWIYPMPGSSAAALKKEFELLGYLEPRRD